MCTKFSDLLPFFAVSLGWVTWICFLINAIAFPLFLQTKGFQCKHEWLELCKLVWMSLSKIHKISKSCIPYFKSWKYMLVVVSIRLFFMFKKFFVVSMNEKLLLMDGVSPKIDNICCGVPRVCCLGPLLFLTCIYDLPSSPGYHLWGRYHHIIFFQRTWLISRKIW